jgi:uncharacterized protein
MRPGAATHPRQGEDEDGEVGMDVFGLELAIWALVVVATSALLGGVAQSSLGFGAAFVVVPALAFTAPELLPGSVLVGILPLSVVMAVRGRSGIDVPALQRLTIGRIPGIVTGAAVVALLPTRALTATIALLLLAAVVMAAVGAEIAVTRRNELVAGYVSGLTGTAAALGGPPLAILYRGLDGAVLRLTLAAVWAIGLLPAIGSLAVAGEFTALQLRAGGVVSALMMLGLVGGSAVVRWVPDRTIRGAVLWWAGFGGLFVLGRAALG